MTPIKIIFSSWNKHSGWSTSVFRDAHTLRDTWAEKLSVEDWSIACVHVGYDSPTYDIELLQEAVCDIEDISKPVLLSQSTKWALPSAFTECSKNLIAYCTFDMKPDNCPLYLSHRGWGYVSDFEPYSPRTSEAIQVQSKYTLEDAKDWLIQFCEDHPLLASKLLAQNISNDAQFLVHRTGLELDLQYVADNYRFDQLVNYCDITNPLEILRIAPSWLLNCPMEHIELSVRVANVFRREGIAKTEDINRYSINDLMRMQNFGRKSILTLAQSLLDAYNEYKDQPSMLISTDFDQERPLERGLGEVSLHTHLSEALAELPKKPAQILTARLGFDGNTPLTLQELGEIFGITRERIRQIEKKYLRRLIEKEIWDDYMVHRIEKLLSSKNSPLFLEFVGIEDPWFDGFTGKLSCLAEVLTRFSAGKLNIIKFEGRQIVSKLDNDSLQSIIKDIKKTLDECKDSRLSKIDIQEMIRSKLLGFEVEFLFDLVWDSLSDNLHFSFSNEIEILTGIGRTADNLVRIVLEQAEAPLHYTEVHRRVLISADRPVEMRRVHSCLAGADYALLYDRGTYGTRAHLKYSPSECEAIVCLSEEIIKAGPEEKQWHSSEILEDLIEDHDFNADITLYELSIILAGSDELIGLGKNVWVSKFQEGLTSGDRIQVTDALIVILEKANGPLSTLELRERLSAYRGIKANMQINSNDVMIRISPDQWGLVHRDIPLSQAQIKAALDVIHRHLTQTQKALHVSEFKNALLLEQLELPDNFDAYAFHSLSAMDDRFRIWHGHLIGLANWTTSRRETVASAIRKAYEAIHSPFQLKELQNEVEVLLERPVGKTKVSNALWLTGAIYDKNNDLWQKGSFTPIEVSNDELPEQLQMLSNAQGG